MLKYLLIIWMMILQVNSFAQQQRADSNAIHKNTVPLFDSANPSPKPVAVLKHDPKKATFRSAVLPGWGQAYNKEYWKIPIVYAAIGIPAGFFFYNNKWYKKTKFAYEARIKAEGTATTPGDSSDLPDIDPKLSNLPASSLQFYRSEFRKNRDYSVLYFIIAWGLNVVDATVFAHLKEFDVSDDLSLQFKPTISNRSTGLSLVLNVKNGSKKYIDTNR
jgi:hypothetical protein